MSYYEYESLGGAWEGGLRDAMMSSGVGSAVVVPHEGVMRELKYRMRREGLSLVGVAFWTVGGLRRHLVASGGLGGKKVGLREDLQWVARGVAREYGGHLGRAVEGDPEILVKAVDAVVGAGYEAGEVLGELAGRYVGRLGELGIKTVQEVEGGLKGMELGGLKRVLLVGFGSGNFGSLRVLLAGVRAAEEAGLFFMAEGGRRLQEQVWQGTWEGVMGRGVELIIDADEQDGEAVVPEFYIGGDLEGEKAFIVSRVKEILAEDAVGRIGVVFGGEGSVLARGVGAALEAEGVRHFSQMGHYAGRGEEEGLMLSWCRWQGDYRGDYFMDWVRQMGEAGRFEREVVEGVEADLLKGFRETGTDDMGVLRGYLSWEVEGWERLGEVGVFAEYVEGARGVCEGLGWEAGVELLEARLEGLGRGVEERTQRRDFLEWLSGVMQKLGRVRSEGGSEGFARVQLVSPNAAVCGEWEHLILAEMNEAEVGGRGLVLLKDGRIGELNAGAVVEGAQGEGHVVLREGVGWVLDSRAGEWERDFYYGKLVEGARGSLVLTAHDRGRSVGGERVNLSAIYERLYFESVGELLDDGVREGIVRETEGYYADGEVSGEGAVDTAGVVRAYEARRDAGVAFDEYSFSMKGEGLPLSCKAWEGVLRDTGAGFIEHVVGLRGREAFEREDVEGLMVGTWVHRWLEVEGGVLPELEVWLERIEGKAELTRVGVEKRYGEGGRGLPEWWRALWARAKAVARELAVKVSGVVAGAKVHAERALPGDARVVVAGACDFGVSGRPDLVVEEGGSAWILDFKTGGQGGLTLKKIKRGEGLQLALYALAYRHLGYKEVGASVVKPGGGLRREVTGEGLAGEVAFFEALGRMERDGVVGQLGGVRKGYGEGGRRYPLATLQIDEEILEAKWGLTHPGLVEEEVEV